MPPRTEESGPLANVKRKLNLPELARIVKYGRRGAAYELHLHDGRIIRLGSSSDLESQARVRSTVRPQVRRSLTRLKTAEWDDLVGEIEQAAEEIDELDPSSTQLLDRLATYAGRARTLATIDVNDLTRGEPFNDQMGKLHFRLDDYAKWATRELNVHVDRGDLTTTLHDLGFTRKQLSARRDATTVVKRSYWIASAPLHELGDTAATDLSPSPSYTRGVNTSRGDDGDTGTSSSRAGSEVHADGDGVGTSGDRMVGGKA